MIQLYKRENTNYSNNGDYILQPTSCTLEQKINDTWILTLEYPFSETEEYNEIINEAVIAVPTTTSEKQLYRIYNTENTDDGITALARPIFLDSANDTMLLDVRPTLCTGKVALDKMCAGTKYTADSDIIDTNTAYYIRKNLIEAIASDDEQSFLNRWGGEIDYDNFKIIVNKRLGRDKGVRVAFGKNLQSITETINFDNIVTRILPIAYNGYTLEINNPYVNSEKINNYAIIRTRVIEYSDVKLKEDCSGDEIGYSDLTLLRAELVRRCNLEYENGIDLPVANYAVNMIDLSQTEEYKDYAILEKVQLGDTVHCKHKKLNIETSARAISISYDCINRRINNIELGEFIPNYIDDMSSIFKRVDNIINENGTVKGESIAGMIDLMNTKLKASREIAKKQQERAILFEDLDPNSTTFGAMAIGTTGFQIASSMNSSGEWIWSTFGTGEGFLADCIIAGVLYSKNYTEGKQGVKIDLNQGLIDAYNFAWKAANSSMTAAGTLETKNIKITGGSFNINELFKVTADGKLSWNTTNSSMTAEGKMTCKDFTMSGGSINVETSGSTVSVIHLKYGNREIDIRPYGFYFTDGNIEGVLDVNRLQLFNKSQNTLTTVESNKTTISNSYVKSVVGPGTVTVQKITGTNTYTLIEPAKITLRDGSGAKVITTTSA